MNLSVLICTHNPRRDYLSRVLAALAGQSLSSGEWDLIIVDNASQPPLQLQDYPSLPVAVRLLAEPTLGSVHARTCGLREASADFVVLVDDDNVLHPDYLANAVAFLREHEPVGAVGGVVEPEFETPPPSWLGSHHTLLALRDFGPAPVVSNWKANPEDYPWCAPFGAGMVLRVDCARRYLASISQAKEISIGRQGTAFLGGCEDAEIILYGVLQGGREVAYSPNLRLLHLIPQRRLQHSYLSRLAYQSGQTWGAFCVRHGFWRPVSAGSVWLRQANQFFRDRAWTPAGWLSWRSHSGQTAGRVRP